MVRLCAHCGRPLPLSKRNVRGRQKIDFTHRWHKKESLLILSMEWNI
jgi:hypothetical protein